MRDAELPELTDGELLLCALRAEDWPEHYELDSDPEIARRFGWEPGQVTSSRSRTAQWAQECARMWAAGERAWWAVRARSDGRMLGFVELNIKRPGPGGRANISYATTPRARGRGVAPRAVKLACDFGFARLGLTRIGLLAAADNAGSLSVARKAGFIREGCLRAMDVDADGRASDMVLFSRLAHDPAPASLQSMTAEQLGELLDDERAAWPRQFAGGMLSFDSAYLDALRDGATEAEATKRGAQALLDAFVERLQERLASTI